MKTSAILLSLALGFASTAALAEEPIGNKIDKKVEQGANATKKTARAAKDEVCEMVNGKTKCMKKKMKHHAQNAADKAKTESKY